MQFINYKIPNDSKHDFEREALKNNFQGLVLVSILLFVLEVYLYIMKDKLYGTGNAVLMFILASIVLIPIIWIISKKIDSIPTVIPKSVQFVYCALVLLFTGALFLITQSQIDLSYVYVSSILAISFFLSVNGLERMLLLLSAYIPMIILLPHFQPDSQIIFVIVVNMFIINVIAWVLGAVLRNLKKESFLQRKLLSEKNMLLEELVKKDSMTGLFNHNASFRKLKEEIDYSDRIGCSLSIILIDIDDFKKINDSYGHLMGDTVLKKVSRMLQNTTRTIDTVGRYGGEEFIIILPDTGIEGAKVLAKKIQSELSTTTFENDISITLSGGISEYDNESVEDFIQVTDKKLYIAKSLGKNCFIHSQENVEDLAKKGLNL